MKKYLLLFFILSSHSVFAQTRLCISINKEKTLIEKYYALKADTQIKDGQYSAYTFSTNALICEGTYKNNLKDSIWKYYNWNGNVTNSGLYKNDKKYGIWEALYPDGKIQISYDYTNKKIVTYNPQYEDTTAIYKIISGGDTSYSSLQRPPVYLDGSLLLKKSIAEKLTIPVEARSARIEGKVWVSFIVNADGHLSDYKVLNLKGYGLDEEALYAVKQAKGDWLPGLLNGKPVTVEYDIPVSFTYGN